MADTQLLYRFNQLRSSLDRFLTQLLSENHRAWVFDLNKHEYLDHVARTTLTDVLERLEYQDERDGRVTDICPGIVGASGKLLRLAGELNRRRDEFKQAVLAANSKDREQARRIMTHHGFPRLHFKQLYRHLPVLLKKPDSIRFTWGTTRSIKKITRQAAYQRLARLGGEDPSPGYHKQLELLAQHPKEEPIAIVQDLKPHIKANVCWIQQNGKERNITRRMISAALAILIPMDPGEALPDYSAAFPDSRKPRKPRSDVKIEREAFLPSIRGHRYCE